MLGDNPEGNERPHIDKDGQFQSDEYPTCPPGKVPLSLKDPAAQDLLWAYAQRRRHVDAEFGDDLEFALKQAGYQPTPQTRPQHDPGAHICMREAIELLRKMRDLHLLKLSERASQNYNELTITAHNVRDAYEWLWPLLWTNDPEWIPFNERSVKRDV